MTDHNYSMGYFPCVGGPMSGHMTQPGLGSSVIFIIRGARSFRKARYLYAIGRMGEETWTYLKFAGWEKCLRTRMPK